MLALPPLHAHCSAATAHHMLTLKFFAMSSALRGLQPGTVGDLRLCYTTAIDSGRLNLTPDPDYTAKNPAKSSEDTQGAKSTGLLATRVCGLFCACVDHSYFMETQDRAPKHEGGTD